MCFPPATPLQEGPVGFAGSWNRASIPMRPKSLLPSLEEFVQGVKPRESSYASVPLCCRPLTVSHWPSRDQIALQPAKPIVQPRLLDNCKIDPVSIGRVPGRVIKTSPTFYRSLPVRSYRKSGRSKQKKTNVSFTDTFRLSKVSSLSRSDCVINATVGYKRRHVNKKYSKVEREYIISSCSDKKMTWSGIKREFDRLFGTNPERSVQGLQAWYYRKVKELSCLNQQEPAQTILIGAADSSPNTLMQVL